jgi:hypothetical protein
MQTMTVSQFKSHFSEVLDRIQHGEDIVISYGHILRNSFIFISSYVSITIRKAPN